MPRSAWLLALGLTGCPGPRTTPAAKPPQPTSTPDKEPVASTCPSVAPFETLSWVPPSAEAVSLIDLSDDALPEALANLSAGARTPERQLPIRVAFALGQWAWQVPLLRSTLSRAGFEPQQLVHIALPDGTSAWAWPPSCDLETLTANLQRGWSLSLRTTPYGAVAVAGLTESGEPAFPYDFLAYGASAYVLVPAGRAHAVAQRLAERSSNPSTPSLGETAGALEPAPIRLVVRAGSLLTPGADAGAPSSLAAHRIDAKAWTPVP